MGRLTSLPYTFLGAVLLGLAQSYAQGYIPANPSWVPEGIDLTTPVRLAIPVILLFITLLVLPNAPLRTQGIQRMRESVPRPTWSRSFTGFAVLIGAVFLVTRAIGPGDTIGWSFEPMEMPGGSTYWCAVQDSKPVAGFFSLTASEFDGVPESWMSYLAVDDVDSRVAKAVKAGAKLMKPLFDVPSVGRIAILMQPGGAGIGWMTPVAE